jgi:hypothetical protein
MVERARRPRPIRAVPEPRPRPTTTYYDMQSRQVLGGEPMHLTVCGACCAVVLSGDKAQARHLEWHRLLQEAIDAALPR